MAVVCALAAYFIIGSGNKDRATEASQEAVNASISSKDGTSFTYSGSLNDNDMPEGKGKGVYKEGTYEGEYVDGMRQGQGTWTTADGSNVFSGTFADDKYSQGTLKWSDGSYYVGTFKDNAIDDGKMYDAAGKLDGTIVDGSYAE